MVALPSGIHPDLTHEDREVKRQLGKCHPRVYFDLIRSDIPSSSGVSPSCYPYLRSPLPSTMEISFEGPSSVKPTREELQARVKLLVMGAFASPSPIKGARITRPSSGEGVSVALFGRGVRGGGCAALLILCCRSQGFFEKGY